MVRDRPSLHVLPVAEARECYLRECVDLQSSRVLIDSVVDVEIAPDVPGRLYLPPGNALPVMVFSHGGGWVVGSLETHDQMCRELAVRSGCAVLSVGYRLAPEHPFPAAVDDVASAIHWTMQHGRDHRLARGRLALVGDSAGGNLAIAGALRCRDLGIPVQAQVLFYPVTTTDLAIGVDPGTDGLVLSREELESHQDRYLPHRPDRQQPEASPLDCADLAGLPPATVIAAGEDPIAPQARKYVAALRRAGVRATLHEHPGQLHGFAQFPGQGNGAAVALDQAAHALSTALAASHHVC